MRQAKPAAILAIVFGMTCLAMAPEPGPTADAQETGAPAAATKITSRARPAADLPSPPAATPPPAKKAAGQTYAMGGAQTKAFPDLSHVVDQVTRDLQRRIDQDAKQIEHKLMRQSQFRLGP